MITSRFNGYSSAVTTSRRVRFGMVNLAAEDFRQLVGILSRRPEFVSAQNRRTFLEEALKEVPAQTKSTILGQIDYDGSPLIAASGVVSIFKGYGQYDRGKELLGVLVNHLAATASEEEKPILENLKGSYNFGV